MAAAGALSHVEAQAADVKANWKEHCVSCHNANGDGKTKAGRKAKAKDLMDAKYQASFTDDKAFTSIKEGMKDGATEQMKAYKDKLSDAEIKELVGFVRTLKK